MLHIFFLALFLFPLVACSVYAQVPSAVNTLDQSLFDSEPVEEVIVPEPTPVPPILPSAKKETAADVEPVLMYDAARLQGLNKVTAETSVFEASLDAPATFGALVITLKKCSKSKPEERPENAALMLMTDQKPDAPKTTVFSGWMFSSSPSISALEHPVYDITLLECITHQKR